MADAQRELKVVINSDTSGAEKGLQGFGGSLKNIGTIAAGLGLANLASKVVNVGKSFFEAGIETATFYENAKIGFTTLLKDSEKANSLINQIKKDALATPFDAAALVQGNRLLISAGVSAQEARKDILNLGNAIMATGGGNDELSRMAVNLQQIKNVGKATALDIKQFAFAGIPIYQLLADATGKNVAEVKEMDISYELLSQSLEKAAQKGGMFAGATENAAGSMQQVTSNLKEAISTFAADLLKETGVFDLLKASGLRLTEFLTSAKGPTVAFFSTFKNGLTGIYDLIAKGESSTFTKAFNIDPENKVVSTILGIRNGLTAIFQLFATGNFTKDIGKALGVDEDSPLVTSILNLRTAFIDLWSSIQSFAVAIQPIMQALMPVLEKAFGVLLVILGGVISNMVAILPVFINAGTLIVNIITSIVDGFTYLITAIGSAITNITLFFQNLPTTIMTSLNDLFLVQIPQSIGFMIGYMSTAIPNMINSVIAWFNALPGVILAIMTKFYTSVVNKLAETWTWISSNLPTWPGKIGSFISTIPGTVADIFENAKNQVLGKMNQMYDAVAGIWHKIKSIFEEIINKANEAWSSVQKGFEAGSKVGSRATGGFASGMTLVGENGPELVNLPAGSYVNNASASRDMMSGKQTVVNIYNPVVRSDNDIYAIVNQVKQVLGRESELAQLAAL